MIRLRVRRFFCDHTHCPARTFAEQITALTSPYARRSPLARRMLEAIGLALAGRAGAPASRNTPLRLLRALPEPQVERVAVLGVDLAIFGRWVLHICVKFHAARGRRARAA
jgi:hypothetical protein